MSQENVRQDRRAQADAIFVALNARDFDALAGMAIHPDMEFRSVIAAAEGGVYHGLQGLHEWGETVDSVFDDFDIQEVDFREVDDERAVVIVHITARAKTSGVPIDTRIGQVWTWRDGLLWRNDAYTDVREALEAVGLS